MKKLRHMRPSALEAKSGQEHNRQRRHNQRPRVSSLVARKNLGRAVALLTVLLGGLGTVSAAGAARRASDPSGRSPISGGPGDLGSSDAAEVLAAIGITPARFEATSGGVSLAEFQEQLNDLQNGRPIPDFAASPPRLTLLRAHADGLTSAPSASDAVAYAAAKVPSYTCEAFGSNDYTPVINTAGLRGYSKLGFLEECNTPDVISSSCEITAKAGTLSGKPGVNAKGKRNCSADTVVGANFRGRKGTLSADWGAYNSTGYFVQLAGCIIDGKTAYCKYNTTFRVGRHTYFGLVPHTP